MNCEYCERDGTHRLRIHQDELLLQSNKICRYACVYHVPNARLTIEEVVGSTTRLVVELTTTDDSCGDSTSKDLVAARLQGNKGR